MDISANRIHAYNPATHTHTSWETTEPIVALFPDYKRQWLVCGKKGIYRTQLTWGATQAQLLLLAPFDTPISSMRLNDAAMDAKGRIWVTSVEENLLLSPDNPANGSLLCWDPLAPSQLHTHVRGLKVGNGLAFNLDQTKLYLSDSHPSCKTIHTYDFALEAGILTGRTLFATLKEGQGRPDGAAIDELDGYWICGIDAGVIHRFTPNGVLERSVYVPTPTPTKLCFGNYDLGTLYVTHLQKEGEKASSVALFKLDPGVKGTFPMPHSTGPL